MQGIGVYFQVPRNYQVLEEILTAKSKKSKKEEKKGPKNKNLFGLFFLIDRVAVFFAVNLFIKARCFSVNIDVEKVNALQSMSQPWLYSRKNAMIFPMTADDKTALALLVIAR
jgi:hypothetical protein